MNVYILTTPEAEAEERQDKAYSSKEPPSVQSEHELGTS
jgi:hypothetical protein